MLEVGGNSPRAPKLSPGIRCACCCTKDNYSLEMIQYYSQLFLNNFMQTIITIQESVTTLQTLVGVSSDICAGLHSWQRCRSHRLL